MGGALSAASATADVGEVVEAGLDETSKAGATLGTGAERESGASIGG